MENKNHKWWAEIIHFGTHAIVGLAICIILAVPVVAFHLFLEWVVDHHWIDQFAYEVLIAIDHAVLVADGAVFLAHLWRSTKKAFFDNEE